MKGLYTTLAEWMAQISAALAPVVIPREFSADKVRHSDCCQPGTIVKGNWIMELGSSKIAPGDFRRAVRIQRPCARLLDDDVLGFTMLLCIN